MLKFLKQMFCRHKWEIVSKPWIVDGMTKFAYVRCTKCDVVTIRDIFKIK